ncbi:unnamed protein product [Urochloa humidicola]
MRSHGFFCASTTAVLRRMARLVVLFFSGLGLVVGEWVSGFLHGWEMHSNNFICRGFGIDDVFSVSSCCIDARFLCVVRWFVFASLFCVGAKSVAYAMLVGRRSSEAFAGEVVIGLWYLRGVLFRRFVYQHEKSGWFFLTTSFGGSAPFRDSSSSAMGSPMLVASDSLMNRRCDGPRPSFAAGAFSEQDACRSRHDAQDGNNNLLPSPERRSASRSVPRPATAKKTGRCYKDLFVISESCKDVLVIWSVFS